MGYLSFTKAMNAAANHPSEPTMSTSPVSFVSFVSFAHGYPSNRKAVQAAFDRGYSINNAADPTEGERLDITVRAAQVLHDLGARTIDDVCALTRPQIEAAGCKARDVASVVQALFALGRRLRRVARAKGPPAPRKGGASGKSIRVEGDELAAQRAAILAAAGVSVWPGSTEAGILLGVSSARVREAWGGRRVRPETLAAWSERAARHSR